MSVHFPRPYGPRMVFLKGKPDSPGSVEGVKLE